MFITPPSPSTSPAPTPIISSGPAVLSMAVSMPPEQARRSKRIRRVKQKKKELAVSMSNEQLPSFFNQLPRSKLEELLQKLYCESVDCSLIIREEAADGLLVTNTAKPETAGTLLGPRNLGGLRVLPNEVIALILSFLGIKDLLIVTGRVCKSLAAFRWLRMLWERIDTRDVTYGVLNDICPTIDKFVPGAIKHVVVNYKCQMLPKAEKFLFNCARFHNLESVVLWQSDGTITPRRLENIKRFLSDNRDCGSFRNVKRFKIHVPNDYCGRDYPITLAEICIDLTAYWPKLESFIIDMPRGYGRLSDGYLKRLSHAGSEVKGTPLTRSMNFITHLTITQGIRYDTEILLRAGAWFPELESLKLTDIDCLETLISRVKGCSDYDNALICPLPRLRRMHVGYGDVKDRYTQAFSVVFFAILRQAPNLTDYIYTSREHFDKLKLFNSIKKWHPTWRPIHHNNLRHLTVKDWGIEWPLLSFKGPCKFPKLMEMDMQNCTTIDATDPAVLMRGGGKHR